MTEVLCNDESELTVRQVIFIIEKGESLYSLKIRIYYLNMFDSVSNISRS